MCLKHCTRFSQAHILVPTLIEDIPDQQLIDRRKTTENMLHMFYKQLTMDTLCHPQYFLAVSTSPWQGKVICHVSLTQLTLLPLLEYKFVKIKVKVLVYNLPLAVTAMTLQASQYLLMRELHQTFSKEFPSAFLHILHICRSTLSISQGFITCLRVLLCRLT